MKQYRPASDQIHIAYRDGLWHVVRSQDGGRGPHNDEGPGWKHIQAARNYMDALLSPVSPLRVEASPLDAKQSPPPASVLASNEAASA